MKINLTPLCSCGNFTKEVTGADIYPHIKELFKLKFYRCKPCNAYAGCHVRTGIPFGLVANKAHRQAKRKAHSAFDPIWRNGKMKKTEAYKWLSCALDIPFHDCHIGMFTIEMCNKTVKLCMDKLNGKSDV